MKATHTQRAAALIVLGFTVVGCGSDTESTVETGRDLAPITYVTDALVRPPPTSGPRAYYATYGAFGPDRSGFPSVGATYTDPVFGTTIRRLTNELGKTSDSEIYSRNGYFNATGQLVHHRSPSGHDIVDTTTGKVVRANVAFNANSSFAPDDPDAWYSFALGDATLYRYSVATGAKTAVKTFGAGLGENGGSVDWIDRSGRYMVLRIGGATRVYDKQTDTLYAGAIPASYGGGGGWIGISPDANYVITSTSPRSSHSWRIDHASKSVSTTPVLFWTLCGGHGDTVSASNGKTYYVTFDCNSTNSIYRVDVTLPQSASNVQKQLSDNKALVPLPSWSDHGHFSRVSKGGLRDWMYASIESGDDGFTSSVGTWRPYKQEIVMMNVLTGEVRRLAHHRSRGLGGSYYYQPRVSASWDGGIVAWTSNFGYSGAHYSDLYAIAVGSSGAPPPPPPPPPPPTDGGSDPSPTTVSVTAPADGVWTGNSIEVRASANDAGGLERLELWGAGKTFATFPCTATACTGSTWWITGPLPAAAYQVQAVAFDKAGHRRISAPITIYKDAKTPTRVSGASTSGPPTSTTVMDGIAPMIAITSPSNGAWTGNSIGVHVKGTDNIGLSTLEVYGNGALVGTVPCGGTSCTGVVSWITGSLPSGTHQITAAAVDAAGNRTTSAPVTINK